MQTELLGMRDELRSIYAALQGMLPTHFNTGLSQDDGHFLRALLAHHNDEENEENVQHTNCTTFSSDCIDFQCPSNNSSLSHWVILMWPDVSSQDVDHGMEVAYSNCAWSTPQ